MDVQFAYREKRTTAESIATQVRPGWTCCTDIAAAIPPAILEALGNRAAAGDVAGVTLHTMLDLWPMSCLSAEAAQGLYRQGGYCEQDQAYPHAGGGGHHQ